MKLTVHQGALADVAKWAAGGIPERPEQPHLALMSLEAADGTLTCAGTDGNTLFRWGAVATVDEPGKVWVSGRLLASLVASLPEEHASLELADGMLGIRCGRARLTLQTADGSVVPEPFAFPPECGTMAASDLAGAIARTAPFADLAGKQTTQPELGCVRLTPRDGTCLAEAADIYHFGAITFPADWGFPVPAMHVPARTLRALARGLSGKVTLGAQIMTGTDGEGNEVPDVTVTGFRCGSRQLISRTIAGKFVNVAGALAKMPADARQARLDGTAAAAVVKWIASVTPEEVAIKVTLDGDGLHLEGGDSAGSTSLADTVPAKWDGPAVRCRVKPSYLADAFDACGSECVVHIPPRLSEERPSGIKMTGTDGFTCMVQTKRHIALAQAENAA